MATHVVVDLSQFHCKFYRHYNCILEISLPNQPRCLSLSVAGVGADRNVHDTGGGVEIVDEIAFGQDSSTAQYGCVSI